MKKFASFFLIFIFAFANIGLPSFSHFCAGALNSSSIYERPELCAKDTDLKAKSCHENESSSESCCDLDLELKKIDVEVKFLTTLENDYSDQFTPLSSSNLNINQFNLTKKQVRIFASPPFIPSYKHNFQSFIQVFII